MEAVELFHEVDAAEANITKLSAGSLALPNTLASMRTVRGHAPAINYMGQCPATAMNL